MNLRRAARIVRQSAKSDIETDVIIDAIGLAGNYFLRETKSSKGEFFLNLVPGDETFSVDDQTDFRPERLLFAETTTYQRLDYRTYHEVAAQYATDSTVSTADGTPKMLAFRTPDKGIVWPTATAAKSQIRIVYYRPLVDIEEHDVNLKLNIPDEYAYDVLFYGAAAVAEHRVPDSLFQDVAWNRFLQLTKKAKEEMAFAGVQEGPSTGVSTIDYRIKEGGVAWH